LQAEGLITFGANRRPTVINLTSGDILELFEIRIVLETLAIEKAAVRITQSILDELDLDLIRMQRATSDPKRWLGLHDVFHDRIYSAAEMPRLSEEIRRLRQSVHPYILMYINLHHAPEIPGQEHSSLLAPLRTRDPERAKSALAEHIRRSAADLVYLLMGGAKASSL